MAPGFEDLEGRRPTESSKTLDDRQSIRTTLDQRHADHASDLRRKSLFRVIDEDGSGAISQEEFDKLYDVMREQAEKDVSERVFLARKVTTGKRNLKVAGCIGLVMVLFLAMSVAANFFVTFVLLEVTISVQRSLPCFMPVWRT